MLKFPKKIVFSYKWLLDWLSATTSSLPWSPQAAVTEPESQHGLWWIAQHSCVIITGFESGLALAIGVLTDKEMYLKHKQVMLSQGPKEFKQYYYIDIFLE